LNKYKDGLRVIKSIVFFFEKRIFFYLLDTNTNRDPYPFVGVIEALRGKNKKKSSEFIII
jgi:hypothetical protein